MSRITGGRFAGISHQRTERPTPSCCIERSASTLATSSSRPTTPTDLHCIKGNYTRPNHFIKLITSQDHRRVHLQEAITTCIIHTPGRGATRCDSSSTSPTRHDIDTSPPQGRLQATHHHRHVVATSSLTLHRQGLHQRGLHQHHGRHTTAALSTI